MKKQTKNSRVQLVRNCVVEACNLLGPETPTARKNRDLQIIDLWGYLNNALRICYDILGVCEKQRTTWNAEGEQDDPDLTARVRAVQQCMCQLLQTENGEMQGPIGPGL